MDKIFALPHINNLKSYIPGMPIETLAREKSLTSIIKLASNENPFGPSSKVLDAIVQNLSTIHRYPDADMHNLKNFLAQFYELSTENFVIGNGSDEILQLIMRTFVNQEHNIIAPKYSFNSYKLSAAALNIEFIETDVNPDWTNNFNNILQNIKKNTKLICVVNPNNPTGTYSSPAAITDFLNQVPPNILVLLDEAYYEYCRYDRQINMDSNIDHSINLLKKHKNLIITRTFSKGYGLAGLRAGYSLSEPSIAASINKIKQPFNVNRLVQFAAVAALNDQEYLRNIIDINSKEKRLLCNHFDNLKIKYIPSATNFITIDALNPSNAETIYNSLLNKGIITRPLKAYDLANYLRISIGLPEENMALIDALKNDVVVY